MRKFLPRMRRTATERLDRIDEYGLPHSCKAENLKPDGHEERILAHQKRASYELTLAENQPSSSPKNY